jgi:glycosyltransferase involved in cell wall biosynthesis
MNVAVVTPCVSKRAGGLLTAIQGLYREVAQTANVRATVYCLEEHSQDGAAWHGVPVRPFKVVGPRTIGFTPAMSRALVSEAPNVLHSHGIWMYPSAAVHSWHCSTSRPYVVSPHGMLDPWALKNSRWKKRIAGWLFENANLRNAACIHALCESEAQSIRAYGLRNPVAIIPNGIDLPVATREQGADSRKKVLLFLGRIHPKKGLVNLLKAWASISGERGFGTADWVLAIAGWDQGGHEAELKRLSTELGIRWTENRGRRTDDGEQLAENGANETGLSSDLGLRSSLHFLGPQFGDEKERLLRRANAFILPSFSEGLPMAVLEAWAYAKSVLITPECNLPEGYATHAAIRIEPSVEGIAEGLRTMMQARPCDLEQMGRDGRKLVEERFTWPRIAREMLSVYEWVLEGGAPPACVRFD